MIVVIQVATGIDSESVSDSECSRLWTCCTRSFPDGKDHALGTYIMGEPETHHNLKDKQSYRRRRFDSDSESRSVTRKVSPCGLSLRVGPDGSGRGTVCVLENDAHDL
jgi:hypothetical protein